MTPIKTIRKPAKAGFSPQARGARNRSAMTRQRLKGFTVDSNFLLTASDSMLGAYELARLAAIADLRSDLQEIVDQLIDTTAQAALARWFRDADRQALKQALETEVDPLAIAREQIQNKGKSSEELEIELERVLSLNPGLSHRIAAQTYQKRNLSEGKCISCPEPLAHNSVTFCEKHLRDKRLRYKPKNAKGAMPGTVGWLHGENFESQHGRTPGTLQSLAISREKKTRAILAELGLPVGSAGTALQAANQALLAHMPHSEKRAMTALQLFDKAGLSGQLEGTAKHALQALAAAGYVQRIGKGVSRSPYLYFLA